MSSSSIFENLKLNVGRRHNIANSRVLQLRLGEIGWQKSWPKKSKTLVRFFQPWFSSLNLTPTQLAIIAGPSNSQYWVFIKHFWEFINRNCGTLEDVISRIRVSCDWWGKLGDENCGQKNRRSRFDFFGCDFHHATTHTLPPSPNRNHQRTHEDAISQIRGSRDCDGSGGGENRDWKNWKHRQSVEKNV